jgi:deoxyribose-phosphate aldolase
LDATRFSAESEVAFGPHLVTKSRMIKAAGGIEQKRDLEKMVD